MSGTARKRSGAPLVDELAAAIHARVLNGELAVGERLRQETLASEFGVSRTPIREALRKLQASGIVDVEPNRGAIVRGPTAREIRDAYEVRAELEGLAAELATTRISDAQLNELRTAEQLFRRSINTLLGSPHNDGAPADGEWAHANDLFHRVIQDAAQNERLAAIVQDLHRTFPRGLTWNALRGSSALLGRNVDEHAGILEAIERRQPGVARERMIAHVRHAGELVARHFEHAGEDVASANGR